jgi:hypothetical protein
MNIRDSSGLVLVEARERRRGSSKLDGSNFHAIGNMNDLQYEFENQIGNTSGRFTQARRFERGERAGYFLSLFLAELSGFGLLSFLDPDSLLAAESFLESESLESPESDFDPDSAFNPASAFEAESPFEEEGAAAEDFLA